MTLPSKKPTRYESYRSRRQGTLPDVPEPGFSFESIRAGFYTDADLGWIDEAEDTRLTNACRMVRDLMEERGIDSNAVFTLGLRVSISQCWKQYEILQLEHLGDADPERLNFAFKVLQSLSDDLQWSFWTMFDPSLDRLQRKLIRRLPGSPNQRLSVVRLARYTYELTIAAARDYSIPKTLWDLPPPPQIADDDFWTVGDHEKNQAKAGKAIDGPRGDGTIYPSRALLRGPTKKRGEGWEPRNYDFYFFYLAQDPESGKNLLRTGTGRKPTGSNTVVINFPDGKRDWQNFGNDPKSIREFFEYLAAERTFDLDAALRKPGKGNKQPQAERDRVAVLAALAKRRGAIFKAIKLATNGWAVSTLSTLVTEGEELLAATPDLDWKPGPEASTRQDCSSCGIAGAKLRGRLDPANLREERAWVCTRCAKAEGWQPLKRKDDVKWGEVDWELDNHSAARKLHRDFNEALGNVAESEIERQDPLDKSN